MRIRALLIFPLLLACGGGPESAPPATSAATKTSVPLISAAAPELRALVDAPDRDPEDKKLDGGRKPAELLAFAGIKPGMKVADIAAGGGYTSELLARAVGPSGTVYAQNNPWIMNRFAEKPLTERLAKAVNKNVVKVVREFDDPLPPEAKDLDVVIDVLFYHDLFWMNEGTVDRGKMNAAIMRALKPGGLYVVVDHSAKDGAGANEVSTLHRIEEKLVKEEVTKAGFKLVSEGDFLRNPNDPRDWNASPRSAAEKRGTSDRFVLAFAKP